MQNRRRPRVEGMGDPSDVQYAGNFADRIRGGSLIIQCAQICVL